MRNGWLGAGLTVVAVVLAGCVAESKTPDPPDDLPPGTEVPTDTTPVPSDGGTVLVPDGGPAPTPEPDPQPTANPGPWPKDRVVDYSAKYGVGTPQSVGLDEAYNVWLLDGARIGVLRPGDGAPKWTHGVGQARQPFGNDGLATGSTVICGGEAGRAYVGYSTYEMRRAEGIKQRTFIPGPGEPYYSAERYAEYQKGDLDAVRLQADGSVALEEHLWRTPGASNAGKVIGIHNTNDFHYEEDRTVLSCARVTRGPYKGDLYITTNHGVTRIQGLTYNSHRHPGWYLVETTSDGSTAESLQCPYMHGLGIGQNGDVLVANEQMVGILVPNGNLADWDTEQTWDGPVPWRFKSYNHRLNGQGEDDFWRAFEQVKSGAYYLGSARYGLWALQLKSRSTGEWTRVAGLPSAAVYALAATDDGALYVGTQGAGLWRLEPDGVTLARVAEVSGSRVLQLVYEPNVTPSMLLVLTEKGLTVLRGP